MNRSKSFTYRIDFEKENIEISKTFEAGADFTLPLLLLPVVLLY